MAIPPQTSTSVTGLSSTTATLVVEWECRTCVDSDMPVVIDMLERKCEFDRSLNGEPVSALKVPPSEKLGSLCPELPHGKFLFVEEPGVEEPLGFAMYALKYVGFGPPFLWLEDLYVDQTRRSRGAGSTMMTQLASIAQDHGATHLAWGADKRNIRGIEFYHKIGAKTTGIKGNVFSMEWTPY